MFINQGTTNGLALSGDGTFTNEGNLSGTINVDGGTLENITGSMMGASVIMTGGTFNHIGWLSELKLKGGTFDLKSGNKITPITMSGGTLTATPTTR